MTIKDVEREAHELITGKIEAGEIVQMQWAVNELILQQGEISGDGVPFYRLCAREFVYRVVKKAVEKYDKHEPDDEQLTLKGYVHLHAAYTVERDGTRQLVPVHLIDSEELLKRADEFDRQSEGLQQHAREIRLFVYSRDEPSAAIQP